jgi:hypothetical protein
MTPREALDNMFPKTARNPLGQPPAPPASYDRHVLAAWHDGMQAVAVAACELVERRVEQAKQSRQSELDAGNQQHMKDVITHRRAGACAWPHGEGSHRIRCIGSREGKRDVRRHPTHAA